MAKSTTLFYRHRLKMTANQVTQRPNTSKSRSTTSSVENVASSSGYRNAPENKGKQEVPKLSSMGGA